MSDFEEPPPLELSNLKIAVLHKKAQDGFQDSKMIALVQRKWVEWGADVVDVYGVDNYVPADLLVVHVDLSIVPGEYQEFASRYERTSNASVLDIRKSVVCDQLLSRGDPYSGQVLVKSNLNFAGLPEQFDKMASRTKNRGFSLQNLIARATRKLKRSLYKYPDIYAKSDYAVFDSLDQVPDKYFNDRVALQKFMPEMHEDKFVLREYYFLGSRGFTNVEVSDEPIITHGEFLKLELQPPPEEVSALRSRLKMNYGKIDYAIHEGKPVIFDVNKTTGVSSYESPRAKEFANYLAYGVEDLL
jgi:hypothetical protein